MNTCQRSERDGMARQELRYFCRITAMSMITADQLLMELEAPTIAANAMPGQFVSLATPHGFLRRPIGIARTDRDKGRILLGIRLVGEGTRSLLKLAEGGMIDVIGPLGHGFEIDAVDEAFLLGGGSGIYPLLFLADELRRRGVPCSCALGFRSASDAAYADKFRTVCDRLALASESGDLDVSGFGQAALDKLWADRTSATGDRHCVLFCCGPVPMMALAASEAGKRGFACQVSMEERMGCGFGICRTCAVRMQDRGELTRLEPYTRCCIEGPVYRSEDIVWPDLSSFA